MSSQDDGAYRSITGKKVHEGAAPTHVMLNSVPVPIAPEVAALGFDKVEEEAAVCDLRNISRKEVKNRQRISNIGGLVSLLGVIFFIINDSKFPRYFRLVMNAPFGVWIGYLLSAQAGI
jgi:hypothetical protein